MKKKSIRKATAEDLSALVQIRNDAVAYKLEHDDLAWGKNGWTEAAARQNLDRRGAYVIALDGIPAGMMLFTWQDEEYWGPQPPDAGYVHGLSLRDGFHGLGLGSYAIDWCADQVRTNNRKQLRLDCDVRNAKLCAYYEALGFLRVATRPISVDYVASFYERACITGDGHHPLVITECSPQSDRSL
jgi:ribosomal protein S18 acetylase RimI-like enzyme